MKTRSHNPRKIYIGIISVCSQTPKDSLISMNFRFEVLTFSTCCLFHRIPDRPESTACSLPLLASYLFLKWGTSEWGSSPQATFPHCHSSTSPLAAPWQRSLSLRRLWAVRCPVIATGSFFRPPLVYPQRLPS